MQKLKSKRQNNWKAQLHFRILVTGTTIDPPGATFGPRKQNHYEFIWIMEGAGTATFDKQVIHAGPGTILLRRPGVEDYYEWSSKRRTVHAFIHFDLDPKRKEIISESSVPPFRSMPSNDIFRSLFAYLLNLNEKREPAKMPIMLNVLNLMIQSYVMDALAVKPPPPVHLPAAVERVVEIIRVNTTQVPPRAIHLKELAQVAHTTPENLCRLFKKSLEMGPLKYAKLTRLERAANQLRRTSLSLKEIALSTGFYDSYHFSRSFKQVYGVSPKEFNESIYNDWLSQKNPIIQILCQPIHTQPESDIFLD